MPSSGGLAPLRNAAFLAGVALGVVGCGDGVGEPIRKDTSLSGGDGDVGAYCASVVDWDETAASDEDALATGLSFLGLVGGGFCSAESRSMSAPALTLRPELRCSARRHSRDMAKAGALFEVSPEGEEPGDRMRQAGYAASAYGEIVLRGTGPSYQLLAESLAQRGRDCEELGDERWVAVGVGRFQDFLTVDLAGVQVP